MWFEREVVVGMFCLVGDAIGLLVGEKSNIHRCFYTFTSDLKHLILVPRGTNDPAGSYPTVTVSVVLVVAVPLPSLMYLSLVLTP